MRRSLPTIPIVLLALAAALLAGCGSDDSADGSDAPAADAGSLTHVDGLVVLQEDRLVVTPADGAGEDLTFELGPELEVGEVRAIEASGAPARVSYRPGEQPLVAAAVGPAPQLGEGLETYEGQVVSVDAKQLVVEGADGERTFDVSAAEGGVFDVPHLEDHAAKDEPVVVYFDASVPEVGVAYEDA